MIIFLASFFPVYVYSLILFIFSMDFLSEINLDNDKHDDVSQQ